MSKPGLKSFLLSTALATTLLAAAVCGAMPASADTLADALTKAYQTSPLLQAGRSSLRSLDENVPQARSTRRPQVSAGASGSAAASDLDRRNQSVYELRAVLSASLLLFDNGESKAALESARNTIAAGRADLLDLEQQVLFSAIQAYVDVRRDEEFVTLGLNDEQRLTETLDATRNRFDVGEVTRTDVSQSEARLAESRSNLAAARGQLEVSRAAYEAAVGTAPGKLAALPPLPDVPKSETDAANIAMRRNPAIIAAQFDERVAVYDFDRARAASGFAVSATATGGVRRGNSFSSSLLGGIEESWTTPTFGEVAVEGSLPLYTGGNNSSLIRQAQAVLDQRRHQVQETGRTVQQDVASAWAELTTAKAAIVARREQAEAARIAAEGVAEEARLGARSTIEVLDADQDRLEAQAEIVRAIRDEYVAAYGLLRAMGLLTVEHLKLGVKTYDPDVNFKRVQAGPVGGYDTGAVDRIRARWEK